jgi:hypothetical protein
MGRQRPIPRLVLVFTLTLALVAQMAVLTIPAGAEGSQIDSVIIGKVTDMQGKPISNCDVNLTTQRKDGTWYLGADRVYTDADGNFRIEHSWSSDGHSGKVTVHAGRYTDYRYRARFYGDWQIVEHKTEEEQVINDATHIDLTEPTTDLGTIKLNVYNATIKGRVTTKVGMALSGVRVRAYKRTKGEPAAYNPVEDAYTDSSGRYVLEVPPVQRPDQVDYVVYLSKDDGGTWQPKFYKNFPLQETSQGGQPYPPEKQALHEDLTSIKIDSGETFVADAILGPMTKEKLTVVSVARAVVSKSFTICVRLVPGHYNAPPVKVQLYKYNAAKKSWDAYGKPKKTAVIAQKPGYTEYQLSTKVPTAGKFSAAAVINKHWVDPNTGMTSPSHHRRTSARRAFTVYRR